MGCTAVMTEYLVLDTRAIINNGQLLLTEYARMMPECVAALCGLVPLELGRFRKN